MGLTTNGHNTFLDEELAELCFVTRQRTIFILLVLESSLRSITTSELGCFRSGLPLSYWMNLFPLLCKMW